MKPASHPTEGQAALEQAPPGAMPLGRKDPLLRYSLQAGAAACLYFGMLFVQDHPSRTLMCGVVLYAIVAVWRWRFGGPPAPTQVLAEKIVARLGIGCYRPQHLIPPGSLSCRLSDEVAA